MELVALRAGKGASKSLPRLTGRERVRGRPLLEGNALLRAGSNNGRMPGAGDVRHVAREGAQLHRRLKIGIAIVALLAGSGFAQARSMNLSGTAGYLSEWEMRANLASAASSGDELFSGPLTVTHVGLCNSNGPVEKKGEMKLRISRSPLSTRVSATLSFDDVSCTYDGPLSSSLNGSMECSDAKGVPLQMTVK